MLPGSPEHGLALGVIDALTDENGGDRCRGTRNGGHGSACSFSDGVQTRANQRLVRHQNGCEQGDPPAISFPLRDLWKALLSALGIGGAPCASAFCPRSPAMTARPVPP